MATNLSSCNNIPRGKWVLFLIGCSGTWRPNTKITINKTDGISVHALDMKNYNVKSVPNCTHFGSRRISSSWDTNWLIFELSILKLTSWCLSRSTWNWYIFLSPNLFISISRTGLQSEMRALLTIGWRKQYKKCNNINVIVLVIVLVVLHLQYIFTISSQFLSLQTNNFSIGSPTQHTICISVLPTPISARLL